MLSASLLRPWSSATSAQEAALSCTWTGEHVCMCVCIYNCLCSGLSSSLTSSWRRRSAFMTESLPPSSSTNQNPRTSSSWVLFWRTHKTTSCVSVSLSVSSWMTSCGVWLISRQWSGRSKVKLRVHVVWFVLPAALEPSYFPTRKTIWWPGGSHCAHNLPISFFKECFFLLYNTCWLRWTQLIIHQQSIPIFLD